MNALDRSDLPALAAAPGAGAYTASTTTTITKKG
jgi:hypothetical protein